MSCPKEVVNKTMNRIIKAAAEIAKEEDCCTGCVMQQLFSIGASYALSSDVPKFELKEDIDNIDDALALMNRETEGHA